MNFKRLAWERFNVWLKTDLFTFAEIDTGLLTGKYLQRQSVSIFPNNQNASTRNEN